jgi:hypothetical protein
MPQGQKRPRFKLGEIAAECFLQSATLVSRAPQYFFANVIQSRAILRLASSSLKVFNARP